MKPSESYFQKLVVLNRVTYLFKPAPGYFKIVGLPQAFE